MVGPGYRNRYKYAVTRDTAFEFVSSQGAVRGVIPKGFLCDGFSLPMIEPLSTLIDRLWFAKWLIHDWLMSNPFASINGVKQRVDLWTMSEVFGGLTHLILFLASFIVHEKKVARYSMQKQNRMANILTAKSRM